MAHVLNVILALVLSTKSTDDPCNWYFITILFDTTVGVGICYVILSTIEKIFDHLGKAVNNILIFIKLKFFILILYNYIFKFN